MIRTRSEERQLAQDFWKTITDFIDTLGTSKEERVHNKEQFHAKINELTAVESIDKLISIYVGALDLSASYKILAHALDTTIKRRAVLNREDLLEIVRLLNETTEKED